MTFRLQGWLVSALERWCDRLHFITHHRPWLWLPVSHCPLAELSDQLDDRWGTGKWVPYRRPEDGDA